MGDVMLFLNVVLVLVIVSRHRIGANMLYKTLVVYIMLMIFRQCAMNVTQCELDVYKMRRAYTSQDYYWYIISGHTLLSLFLTFIVVYSSSFQWIKIFSVILSVMVMFFQAATREHKTVDILITLVIALLAMKAFLMKK